MKTKTFSVLFSNASFLELMLCNVSNQLHLSKLNGVLGLETSDSSSDHLNFPCPLCTEIFDEKAEVVEHIDTCDGTEGPLQTGYPLCNTPTKLVCNYIIV